VFLMNALKQSGCPVSRGNIQCIACEDAVEGARYSTFDKSITICQNYIQSATQVEDALSHELIHAVDDCRVKDFDQTNCKQVACSEIRAANLSGDCKWTRELFRGNVYQFAGAHNLCVRRRARLSMQHNKEACGTCDIDKVLDEVWDACLADTAPFIEIP